MTPSSCPVLVIEDSPEDYEILSRALHKNDLHLPLRHSPDGYDAIDYLKGTGAYQDDPECQRPAFILLDLNLPGMDGIKLAELIKDDTRLKDIPIIAFTTSRNPRDIEATYKAGVDTFLPKPDDIKGYANVAQILRAYWQEHGVH